MPHFPANAGPLTRAVGMEPGVSAYCSNRESGGHLALRFALPNTLCHFLLWLAQQPIKLSAAEAPGFNRLGK